MLSDFSGSFWEIVATVPAGKAGWIDCGNGNPLIGGVKHLYRFLECKPEVDGFYPAEKFLERGEMGCLWEIKDLLNSLHISDVFDELTVMLVPIILEKNEDQKLILGVDFLWKLTGIRLEMSWFYNRNGCLDKPDIPACWSLNCLLNLWTHILVRRQCTLDLSVVGTTCFGLGFQQSKKNN